MRRLADANDLGPVHSIYTHEAVAPFLGHEPLPRDAFASLYAELTGGGAFYVYESDGRVAGFYGVTRHSGRAAHVAQIGTLAVDPALNRRGIGRAMLEDALGHLRVAGVQRVELLVESDNPRAIAFYASLGFAVEGVMRRAYKRAADPGYIDELVMVRFLD